MTFIWAENRAIPVLCNHNHKVGLAVKYGKIEDSIIKVLSRYNYLGLVIAIAFFCLSLLPSLMPRTWLLQGAVSGFSFAVGYGIGLLLNTVIHKITGAKAPLHIRKLEWGVLLYTAPFAIAAFLLLGSVWQTEVRQMLAIGEAEPFHALRVFVTAMLLALGIIWAAGKIRSFCGWVVKKLDARLPFNVSIVLGLGITLLLLILVTTGLLFSLFVSYSHRKFEPRNNTTPENVVAPETPNRSGSPTSFVEWDDLGLQGKKFIGTGPSISDISAFTADEALDPVRLYVGVDSATTARERAEIAVQELERTNALKRKILIVAMPTGTGWLEPKAVDTIEYMHGGDTAIIAQQYSYLPSWISFLADKEIASETGRALFDAVYAKWSALPESERPMLYTYGLSLGSYGSQSAFDGANDMLQSIDGAVYQGTLNDTNVWSEITSRRDAGSPEWQPQFQAGESVRFASTANDITTGAAAWERPRVLYMQHASDPIVWFDFDLIYKKPDWLIEPRGTDVSHLMRWYPFVTFIQVAIDQAAAHSVTDGRGHLYGDTVVESWRAVTQPDDWNVNKKHRLYNALHDR